MTKNNIIAKTITKIISPIIIFYGLYVLINGEESPGGGFQAGAILATYFILLDMVGIIESTKDIINKILFYSSFGILIYLLAGFIPMFLGFNFLNYNNIFYNPTDGQHIYIFCIEIGIAITVSCVLFFLYLSFKSKD
jgi:multicomponent Na+:H+ antiporter subunit B